MALKLIGSLIFFLLLLKSEENAADGSKNQSPSNVAYFNAKIQQIDLPHMYLDKRVNDFQTQANDFFDLLDSHHMQWTEWSFCSQSCGGGVTMRSRNCDERLQSNSEDDGCGDIQYKTCNEEPCPGHDVDSRSHQCSEYNHRPVFPSARFKWTPYYGTNVEPCHLTCKASGFDLYKTFGLVRDGTLCWNDKTDVCIDGKCLKVGCDQIVGSNLTLDACGTCGGDSSGCFHFASNYSQAPSDAVRFNYYEIAMIPSGSTHIKIEETSENILALMEAEGKFVKYVMNGNWIMQRPGPFTAAGTVFKYRNKDDVEVLEGKGPTTMDLHIMMIYLEKRPLVRYEYWIPTKQIEIAFHDNFDIEDSTTISRLDLSERKNQSLDPGFEELVASSELSFFTAPTLSFLQPFPSTAISKQNETTTASSKTNRRHNKLKKRRMSSVCKSCKKPRKRRKHFCSSDFVIRARISSKTKAKGKRYRHDLKILTVYKADFPLLGREYLWIYNGCCPKLRPGRQYLIMGSKDKVRMGQDRGKNSTSLATDATEDWRFETRLLLSHTNYWHPWKQKYSSGMNRLSRKLKCKNARTKTNLFR